MTFFKCLFLFEFKFKFHWSVFPSIQLTIWQHWFRKWLGAEQVTSLIWTNDGLGCRRRYVSLGFEEVKENSKQQGPWGQHGAHLGPESDPCGPYVGPINPAIKDAFKPSLIVEDAGTASVMIRQSAIRPNVCCIYFLPKMSTMRHYMAVF